MEDRFSRFLGIGMLGWASVLGAADDPFERVRISTEGDKVVARAGGGETVLRTSSVPIVVSRNSSEGEVPR